MHTLFASNGDWTGIVLRLTLAFILWPHGAQKMLGWFGGFGFSGTMNFFTQTMHLPWLVGFLVIVIEFAGPFFLLAGVGSRLWAAAIAVLMTGVIVTSHLPYGFFMDWFSNKGGEGFEFHLLVIGLALALLVNGSGRLSVDAALVNN